MLNKEEMFSELAEKYDFLNNIISFKTHKLVKKLALSKLKIKTNSKVLDLCCGTGDLGQIIKEKNPSCEIIGVDFSEDMINIAKQKNPNLKYIKENATNLPFQENSFDYIVIGFGLRNIEQKEKALEEMHRILRKDGEILHLDFCSEFIFKRIYDFYISFITRFFSKNISHYEYLINSKNSFYSTKELISLFKNKNFKVVHSQKLCFGAIAFQILKK